MVKIKAFIRQKPILFSIIVGLAYPVVHILISIPLALLPKSVLSSFLAEAWDLAWPILLAVMLGYGFIFRQKGFFKTMGAGLPLAVYFAFILYVSYTDAFAKPETHWQSLPMILVGIVSMFGVGVREEVVFRGIIGNTLALKLAKSPKGLWQAVLLSGLLFGCMHLANILAGVSIVGVLSQTINAIAMGALFMAVYLRGGSIWAPILIHALIDAVGLFESTFVVTPMTQAEQISQLSFIGVFIMVPVELALTAFLLRKKKRGDILQRLETLRSELKD